MDKSMRIIFMGTPSFGVEALEKIVNNGYNVVGVFTQIDKPRNRLKMEFCPIKQKAIQLGIPVHQYNRLRAKEGVEMIRSLKPDLIITAAYGQILSQEILDIPTHGVFNIHASLLPKYRGGCPIQWAIINGERFSGVTIMRTILELDAGDIIFKKEVPIGDSETYGTLYDKLSIVGADAIIQVLAMSSITYEKQNNSLASYYPVITQDIGEIDFAMDAGHIDCLIRGLNPNPTAYTYYNGKVVKIHLSQVEGNTNYCGSNGQVVVSNTKEGLIVKCGNGAIRILELQMPSKRKMSYKEFLLGNSIEVGTILGKI